MPEDGQYDLNVYHMLTAVMNVVLVDDFMFIDFGTNCGLQYCSHTCVSAKTVLLNLKLI